MNKELDITPKLHKVRLSFHDKSIEKSYLQNYQNIFLKSNRICVLIGILFYGIFGIIDFLYISGKVESFHIIRFGITLPIALGLYILSYNKKIVLKNRFLFSFILLLFSASIIIINSLSSIEYSIYYAFGIIIVFIFGQNFLKVTFFNSTLISLSIVISYEGILLFSSTHSLKEIFVMSFFIILSFLLSSYSGYFFEYIDRKNFWINLQLQDKNNQYRELQLHLEQKVTDRTKLLENAIKDLEVAKSKIEESDTIKSSFLATISHEIRTPLTSILGFSQLIAKSKTEPEKVQKYVDTVEQSTEQLLNIITNILTLSEIHNDRIESTNSIIECKSFISKVGELVNTAIVKYRKDLNFISNIEMHDTVTISMGEKELKTVLLHLFDNAVKYTSKGEIGFSCKINDDPMLEFCVYDSGIGINNQNLSNIFEFFRQEDQLDSRFYNGVGVGLSICKGIIVKSGGKIWVESEKNKGSKFFVTIPIIL